MKENRENHDIKDIKQAKYDFYRRVTTQSSKNRVHVFKGGLKVSSPLKSNLR